MLPELEKALEGGYWVKMNWSINSQRVIIKSALLVNGAFLQISIVSIAKNKCSNKPDTNYLI